MTTNTDTGRETSAQTSTIDSIDSTGTETDTHVGRPAQPVRSSASRGQSNATLLARARGGDDTAWAELTRRYTPLLKAVTAGCGLPESRAADVIQTTWLRLLERHGTIRDPERLGAWLRTVAQREAWKTVSHWRNAVPLVDEDLVPDGAADPVHAVIRRDDNERLWASIDDLPPRQRQLMSLLAADDTISYRSVAERTGMPIGSIGPTRARALERMRFSLGVIDIRDVPGLPSATARVGS